MDNLITMKRLIPFALIGLLILVLFAAGFVWLYSMSVDVFLASVPYCLYPYLAVISVYVGFFAARFAKGRREHAWLWGMGGFALTLLFIFGFQIVLSSVFPYQGLTLFAGPAVFVFISPILSAVFILLAISMRKKAPVQ